MTGDLNVEGLFEDLGVVRRGHYLLSSGLHSDVYLQCQIALSLPAVALRLGRALAERVDEPVDVVASPALGGIVAGFAVAAAMANRFVFAERGADRRFSFRRGQAVAAGERVLVVEDVVTTGGSANEVAALVRAMGGQVAGVACLVDRSGGLAPELRPFPAPVSLLAVRPAVWEPDVCPRCQDGDPLDSPGSRARGAGASG